MQDVFGCQEILDDMDEDALIRVAVGCLEGDDPFIKQKMKKMLSLDKEQLKKMILEELV